MTNDDMQFISKNKQPDWATPSQLAYLHDLSIGRDWEQQVTALPQAWQELFYATVAGSKKILKSDISKFIDLLKSCPRTERMSKPVGAVDLRSTMAMMSANQHLVDGMYRGPQPNNHIYKVYHTVHGANQQVAKRLVIKDGPLHISSQLDEYKVTDHVTVSFKYEGKAPLRFLKPHMRLSIQEAMEFGKLYGMCVVCGRTLTNELSIELGIGPVCGEREFGGEFKFMIRAANAGQDYKQSIDAEVLPHDHFDNDQDEIKALEAKLAQLKGETE